MKIATATTDMSSRKKEMRLARLDESGRRSARLGDDERDSVSNVELANGENEEKNEEKD